MQLPTTLVIPCHNSSETIEEVIDAALGENFHEIICINNNSQDDTLEKLEKLPVLIVEEKVQGTIWARRAGVACAETDWIALIDDDIMLHPGWTQSMRYFISQYAPDATAITGYVDTPLPSTLHWAKTILACNCSTSTQEYHLWAQPLGSSTFIKRDAFLKHSQRPSLIGRDDANGTLRGCGEDIEVFRKILRAGGRVFHNSEAKATHRVEEWRKNGAYLRKLQLAYSTPGYVARYWGV